MQCKRHVTMRPSRASTSRTRVPLARPPMLGLQLISPMLAPGAGVIRSVEAPLLAAAAAASQPAMQYLRCAPFMLQWNKTTCEHLEAAHGRKGEIVPAWPPPTTTTSTHLPEVLAGLPISWEAVRTAHVSVEFKSALLSQACCSSTARLIKFLLDILCRWCPPEGYLFAIELAL